MERYSRQNLIEGWNQEKLMKAKVMVAGVGGLGSVLTSGLARVGVGRLDLVDYDVVELSNLSRQLFDEEDIGKYKAVAAKEKLEKINSEIKICAKVGKVEIFDVSDYDIVADCLDNLSSRLNLNEKCVKSGVNLVSAGMHGFYGQLQVIVPYKTPCLNCNEIITHGKVLGDSCDRIKNPYMMSVGYIMAGMALNEIIKLLMGYGFEQGFIFYDGKKNELRKIEIKRKKYCEVCGDGKYY